MITNLRKAVVTLDEGSHVPGKTTSFTCGISATRCPPCYRIGRVSSYSFNDDREGWPALIGGGLMNVALGTYYAWSVFVPETKL